MSRIAQESPKNGLFSSGSLKILNILSKTTQKFAFNFMMSQILLITFQQNMNDKV